jgi:hypothetical protein
LTATGGGGGNGGNSGNISISGGVTGTLTKGANAPYHVGPGDGGTKVGTITIGAGAFGSQPLSIAP